MGFFHCLFGQRPALIHAGQETGALGQGHQGVCAGCMVVRQGMFQRLGGHDFRLAVVALDPVDLCQLGQSSADAVSVPTCRKSSPGILKIVGCQTGLSQAASGAAALQQKLRMGAQHLTRQGGQVAVKHFHPAAFDIIRGKSLNDPGCCLPILRLHIVRECGFRLKGLFIMFTSRQVKQADLFWTLSLQPGEQEFTEKKVVPVPMTLIIQAGQEKVLLLELIQHGLGVPDTRQGIA